MIFANEEHTVVNWLDDEGYHSVMASSLAPEQLATVQPYSLDGLIAIGQP